MKEGSVFPVSFIVGGRWSVVGGRWSVVGGRWSASSPWIDSWTLTIPPVVAQATATYHSDGMTVGRFDAADRKSQWMDSLSKTGVEHATHLLHRRLS